jgi:chromosome segregation ATPase
MTTEDDARQMAMNRAHAGLSDDPYRQTCVLQGNVIADLNGTIERLQRERDEAHVEVSIARAGKLVAEQALQQTDDALSACRADNAELTRERDELRADLEGTRTLGKRLNAARELALAELDEKARAIEQWRAELATERSLVARQANIIELQGKRLEELARMYDEVSAEATESLQRIKELEAELAASTDRERQWRESRQGDKSYVATSSGADWRKTREAQAIDILENDDIDLIDSDQKIVAVWLLRWEPKP